MDLLDRLLGHDDWTTGELLRRAAELTTAQFYQQFDIGWGSLQATFAHMISNVQTWTDLMMGEDAEHATDGWGEFDLAALTSAHQSSYRQFAGLARSCQQGDGWNDTWVDTLDDPPQTKTFGGAVLHVITHDMHHRSEVLHMLSRLGLEDLPEGDLLGWEANARTEKGVMI